MTLRCNQMRWRHLSRTARASALPAILGLRQYDYYSGALIDAGDSLDLFMCPVPVLDESRAAAMVIGACLWIPKTLWQELGGFPEWFQTNAEDIYLCCLARMRGYPVHVPRESGYLHRVGATLSASRDNHALVTTRRRRYLSERNRTRLICIFYPPWLLGVILPLHLATLLIEGIVVSVTTCNSAFTSKFICAQSQMRPANLRTLCVSAERFCAPARYRTASFSLPSGSCPRNCACSSSAAYRKFTEGGRNMSGQLIAIGGAPSSGSTLLADILDSLPGAICGPESGLLASRRA